MYQEHFKLRTLPFADAPDPEIFYLNPVFEAALATLRYGVLTKKGVMVLSGPTGTGKSALLRKLFHEFGPLVKPVWVLGNGVQLDGLLSKALAELHIELESAGRSAMVGALKNFLIESAQRKNFICLVIEEAQNLDTKTLDGLRQLSNFEADGRKLLQLIFVGPPEFIKMLDDPELGSLKQRVTLHVRLVPLSRSEVGRYIEFQVQAAGCQGAKLFDSGAIARIAHYSGGIPRLVNTICDNALLTACRGLRTEVSQSVIDDVAKDMGFVPHEQPCAAGTVGSENRQDARELKPDRQFEIVWANLQRDRASAKSGIIALAPWRTIFKMFGVGLAVVITAIAAGAILRFEKAGSFLENLTGRAESGKSHSPLAGVGGEIAIPSPLQQTVGASSNTASTKDAAGVAVTALNERNEYEASAVSEKSKGAAEAQQFHSASTPIGKEQPSQDPAVKGRLLEIEIQKAIRNRAISGVTVRLKDDTAILGGRVASARQRVLAERAAMSVSEVAKVDNRISIQR